MYDKLAKKGREIKKEMRTDMIFLKKYRKESLFRSYEVQSLQSIAKWRGGRSSVELALDRKWPNFAGCLNNAHESHCRNSPKKDLCHHLTP